MDELGNTESSYYQPPVDTERLQAENEEKAKVSAGMQLLEEMIMRLEERATFYDSLSSVTPVAETDPEEHLRQCVANAQTKANLMEEINYFTNLRDTYSRG